MKITLDEGYNAMCDFAYFGYVGEVNAREISILDYIIPEATAYKLKVEYPDKTVYELPIKNGICSLGASIFKTACEVKCQIVAYAVEGEVYKLVRKSDVFKQEIRSSIDESGIPSYEESLDALDKILQYESNSKEYAERAEAAAIKSEESESKSTSSALNASKSETAVAGYAQTAKTNADSTTADKQAVQTLAEQVTADKTTVADYAAKVAEDKTAIDETKTDIDKKYTEISNTATKLNTEYNNLTSNYYTKELANSTFATKTEINNTNTEVSELKEDLEKQPNLFKPIIGLNKLDNSLLVDGKRILSNGTIGDLESACATEEYIEISQENGNYIALYTCIAETGNPNTCCYATAFYDANKAFISQTRLSGVSVNNGDCRIKIPSAAKYIRTSFIKNIRFKYMCIFGSADMELKNYEPYHCKEPYPIPNDLDEKLNNLEILSENFSKKDYPVHHDNAEFTITNLRNSFTFNQNDFTFVKDELWLAKHNSNDFSNGTGIFRHKWDGEQFVHIGTINCDFGHLNVVDYCEANDCLIFGNGANDFETEGNYFVVVPHPLELGDTALIADVGIKYSVDIGYKVQALWGDSNLGENNIAVLLSNDLKTIVKVLLKRDLSGNFNGEFIELERKENLPAFGIQGADIWNNTLYVGGAESSGMYTINKVSLSDYSSVKNSVKYYKDDGTPYLGVVQGVYVGGDYVWVFVNTDAPQTGKCCFLTKYRR